jgi:predicted nucleotidyltransferase
MKLASKYKPSANNRLPEITRTIQANKRFLNERYRVKELGIFGSYLRGEQKAKSDLDLLVEFFEPIGLFDFIRLENELTRLLGIKVDLVMKESLKTRLKDQIIKEARYI